MGLKNRTAAYSVGGDMSQSTNSKSGAKVRAFVARATWAGLVCVPAWLPAYADDGTQKPGGEDRGILVAQK